MPAKLKVQVQKEVDKPKTSFLDVTSGRERVLVTIKVEADDRESADRVMRALAEFTEKFDAGNSQ